MSDPRVKDTLLVTAVVSGLGALALTVVAIVLGRGWWIALLTIIATVWFALLYVRELRRFRRDAGGAAGL